MTRREGLIIKSQAHLLKWHAMIVSGAYKARKLFHGTGDTPFTDEEKLEDALGVMDRHIEILGKIVEDLPSTAPVKVGVDEGDDGTW